jgi:hypothetical protein
MWIDFGIYPFFPLSEGVRRVICDVWIKAVRAIRLSQRKSVAAPQFLNGAMKIWTCEISGSMGDVES